MKRGESMNASEIENKLNELKNYTTAWVVIKNENPNIYGSMVNNIINIPDKNCIYLKQENKYISYSDIANIIQIY